MAKNTTRGYYTFKDGYTGWYNALSAAERKREIRLHGAVVKFVPTN